MRQNLKRRYSETEMVRQQTDMLNRLQKLEADRSPSSNRESIDVKAELQSLKKAMVAEMKQFAKRRDDKLKGLQDMEESWENRIEGLRTIVIENDQKVEKCTAEHADLKEKIAAAEQEVDILGGNVNSVDDRLTSREQQWQEQMASLINDLAAGKDGSKEALEKRMKEMADEVTSLKKLGEELKSLVGTVEDLQKRVKKAESFKERFTSLMSKGEDSEWGGCTRGTGKDGRIETVVTTSTNGVLEARGGARLLESRKRLHDMAPVICEGPRRLDRQLEDSSCMNH